jgi:hypothetical protein
MRSGASGSISRKAFFDPLLPGQRQTVSILAVPGCLLGVASGSTSQAIDLACICFIRVFLYQGFPGSPSSPPGAPAQEGPGWFVTEAALEAEIRLAMTVPDQTVLNQVTGIARPQAVHARQATPPGIRYTRQGSIT